MKDDTILNLVLLVITPASTTLALWFLIRFINAHDSFRTKVNDKLDHQSSKIMALSELILKFQSKIDLNMEKVTANVDKLRSHFSAIEKRLDLHHESLSKTAQIMKRHDDNIASIETQLKVISKDVILVTEKKKS